MKVVLFDLDDTLYPEIAFVTGGFASVARHLGQRCGRSEEELIERQLDILRREGRGRIFDRLLAEIGLQEPHLIPLLVYLYRSHAPVIDFYGDVLPTFNALRGRGLSLGIITDGLASVQRRKIQALGADKLVDIIVCTDELGRDYQKPSVIPYRVALDLLEIKPTGAAYVGNDVSKDFAGANQLEMLTIQIARPDAGTSSVIPPSAAFMAKYVVGHLAGILPLLQGGPDD